jgi:hypothetical protein
LPVPRLDGAKLYADQPQMDNLSDARGLHGKRVQSMALIPTEPGQLQLPSINVRWWDVVSDSEKIAELPAQAAVVRASATSSVDADPALTPVQATAPANTTRANSLLIWQISAALLATAWLVTLLVLWRRKPGLPVAAAAKGSPGNSSEKACYAELEAHCRSGDAAAARQVLLRWAAARYDSPPQTLEHLAARSGSPALGEAIDELERALFGSGEGSWRGESLIKAVRSLRGKHSPPATDANPLRELYPSS